MIDPWAIQPLKVQPKEHGPPLGYGSCYHVPLILNSTYRFDRFVQKLRKQEDAARLGIEHRKKMAKDENYNEFFTRCDRASVIRKVADRVNMSLKAYEEDLQNKRARLLELVTQEEKENIRKFVIQAQEGNDIIWEEKKARLKYLLDKRQKEADDRCADIPFSKTPHVMPCMVKIRAKEAQEIQLYQMREKKAKKMAEAEFDMMWHEIIMREADALTARLEHDAIERKKRDLTCKLYSDYQLAERAKQREIDREKLKQQTISFRQLWAEAERQAEEADARAAEQRHQVGRDRQQAIQEKQNLQAKQKEEDEMVLQQWEALVKQELQKGNDEEALRRIRSMENNRSNNFLIKQKGLLKEMEKDRVNTVLEDVKKNRDAMYKDLDQRAHKAKEAKLETQAFHRNQMKEKTERNNKGKEEWDAHIEYRQKALAVQNELCTLTKPNPRVEWQKKQIEYNKILKQRALDEEMLQRKKCLLAREQYQKEIEEMLTRPSFSEQTHPFKRQLDNITMKPTCPCSKATYCKPVEFQDKNL